MLTGNSLILESEHFDSQLLFPLDGLPQLCLCPAVGFLQGGYHGFLILFELPQFLKLSHALGQKGFL